jgi:hypothetical protein
MIPTTVNIPLLRAAVPVREGRIACCAVQGWFSSRPKTSVRWC